MPHCKVQFQPKGKEHTFSVPDALASSLVAGIKVEVETATGPQNATVTDPNAPAPGFPTRPVLRILKPKPRILRAEGEVTRKGGDA